MNRLNIVTNLLKDHKRIKRPILGEENLVIVMHKLQPVAEECSIVCYPRPFKPTNGAMLYVNINNKRDGLVLKYIFF